MEARRTVVAAFDVDHTVTTGDCVVPFLRRVGGTVPVTARLARTVFRAVPAIVRRDRDALKAMAARAAFAGRAIVDVEAEGAAFADHVARTALRPDTVARLRWHRLAGHEVVFVSASFGVYLRPLAERLGVDAVLGTELEVDDAGRCTGALRGGNCRGPAKVHRLHTWIEERHGERSSVVVWAYGDSEGDRELLADADRAVWVADRLPPMPEPCR